MQKKSIFLIFIISLCMATVVNATSITTSAVGNFFGDTYSYLFEIEDDSDASIFHATLTNTSSLSLSDALIDLLAFNMNPTLSLGTDFNITKVSPLWTFSEGAGGIQFDYLGERTTPGTRLGPGEMLTFDFNFITDQTFDLWLTSGDSAGTGIGGGTDSGQVAVSFQQLGARGNDSDLLASNWNPVSVPEPGTLILLGFGFVGLAAARRKFQK